MQKKSKGTIVFAVVAVLSLGSTIASAGFGRGAHGRFEEARARLASECALAACPPLGTSAASSFPEFKAASKALETPSPESLVRVLESADRIDRSHTLAASLLAAKLFEGVVDRVDADPALLEDARLVSAIRGSAFASSRRPLQSERLHALGVLAAVPSQVPLRTAGLAESTATQAMTDVNTTLHAMEDSALAGDTRTCERASTSARGLAKQVTVGPSICKSAARIVTASQRLRGLQARARMPRPR